MQHDLVHSARRNTDTLGEPILGHSERLEKFLQEYFSWMDRR